MTRHMEYPDSAVALNWHSVERVTNKLQFFNNHKGSAWLPEFWTNKDEIPEEAFEHGVVCRTVLNGHSGAGIVLAHSRDDLCDAPLYVKYIPKKDEYRVHVGRRNRSAGDGDSEFVVISVQRKARKLEVPDEEVNWKIRNLAGGFIFARNNVNPPECVIEVAKEALKASALDFGAADVVFNEQRNQAFCLEINTAPGLEGSTVDDYVNYFKEEWLA